MLFLLVGIFALPAFAQEATIVGTVTDSSGAVVPNADITVTNRNTGQSRNLTSNEVGQYVAEALPIGTYDVKAQAAGFNMAQTTGVVLNVADRRRIDFSLKVGGAQQSVTVEAAPIAIKTESGEQSGLITGEQITQLETNGRSLYSIVNLTPGASSLQNDFQVPTPMGGDQAVSFNGQRFSHNLYKIDGAEAADRGGSGAIVMPSIDSIAEFKQLTSNYSAEYGLSSAATVTSVLKSGTRTLHANAWWFGRNDALNARNFFQPRFNANGSENKMPKLRFNTYGFNVGGPVQFKHSDNPKTFFFYNMEWRSLIQGAPFNGTGVPFPSTYGGNLAEAVNWNAAHGNELLTSGTGILVPDFSKLSTALQTKYAAAGLQSGQPFPNNTIPASLLDPNAQALLKSGIFPAPTVGRQFKGAANSPTNVREELVRVDHQFNDKFSIFGHYIAEQILQTDIPTRWSGGANLPTVGDTFGNPSYSGVIHATHIISPRLLNEIAFNYGGNRINMLPLGKFSLSDTGFQQHKLFGFQSTVTPVINLTTKTGSRYDPNWNPWINKANSYEIRDDLSWSRGAHQLKLGGGWLNFRKLQPLQVSAEGNFGFNGNFTNYDFADFLLGLSSSYSEPALKDNRNWNSVTWYGYVQDNWRASKRLTLNLGLRWDGMPHTAEINGQMSNFLPGLYDPAKAPITMFANANGTLLCAGPDNPRNSGCTAAAPALATGPNPQLNGLLQYANGLGVPGVTPGVSKGLVNNYWNNWGPRLGFAYDLTGEGKTVLRGGFGVMFERIQGNDMYQAGGNNLFGGTVNISNVSLSDPHIGIDQTNTTISNAVLPITVNNITELDPKMYKNPTRYQYSLGVQQQLARQTVLSVSYVGNQNRQLSDAREI
ncbi:MAG TPA: TonB-dependent receptor, partial [Terriglobales bacterium]